MMRALIVVLGAALLVGCAVPPFSQTGHLAQLPPGTTLVVRQPITVPGGQTFLWFQFGNVVPAMSLSLWEDHCSLDLNQRPEHPYQLRNGKFLVTGVDVNYQAAAFSPILPVALPNDADKGSVTIATVLHLSSPDHPQVRQLRCEIMVDSLYDYPPMTVTDLRHTLGRYFDVQLPGADGMR